MSETMAKVAAHNIAADLQGGKRRSAPARRARRDLRPRRRQQRHHLQGRPRPRRERPSTAHVMAGPQAHWAKLAFERYFLASRKRGLVAV